MKHLIKHNNFINEGYIPSKKDLDAHKAKHEILSHAGWEQILPTEDKNFKYQLRYYLTKDIFIEVLHLSESIPYYLCKDEHHHFVWTYGDTYGLFKNYSSYEKMINWCKYLLPFYESMPSEDTIHIITNQIFIDITDIIGLNPEFEWGYSNSSNHNGTMEFGFFPATYNSDKLSFCLIYSIFKDDNSSLFQTVEEEFEYCKYKLGSIGIDPSRASVIDDDYRIVIQILF